MDAVGHNPANLQVSAPLAEFDGGIATIVSFQDNPIGSPAKALYREFPPTIASTTEPL